MTDPHYYCGVTAGLGLQTQTRRYDGTTLWSTPCPSCPNNMNGLWIVEDGKNEVLCVFPAICKQLTLNKDAVELRTFYPCGEEEEVRHGHYLFEKCGGDLNCNEYFSGCSLTKVFRAYANKDDCRHYDKKYIPPLSTNILAIPANFTLDVL